MKKDTQFWQQLELKDIIIGGITIRAHHKGGWSLPGGKVTQCRKQAETTAKELNRLYMQGLRA